jgi:hypothetical protein
MQLDRRRSACKVLTNFLEERDHRSKQFMAQIAGSRVKDRGDGNRYRMLAEASRI